jgi:hypothetical protein
MKMAVGHGEATELRVGCNVATSPEAPRPTMLASSQLVVVSCSEEVDVVRQLVVWMLLWAGICPP